jgi:hypothetical protein
MRSLTLPHTKRISGPRKFQSSSQKDFCNNIGTKRTCRREFVMSAVTPTTDIGQHRHHVGKVPILLQKSALLMMSFGQFI